MNFPPPKLICFRSCVASLLSRDRRFNCLIFKFVLGLSKGVGFIRFDQRHEAEQAIKELNGTVPKGYTEAITVKFANNPSNNKAFPPLAAYLTPQNAAGARRFAGPIHHPTTGRFRSVDIIVSSCLNFECMVESD